MCDIVYNLVRYFVVGYFTTLVTENSVALPAPYTTTGTRCLDVNVDVYGKIFYFFPYQIGRLRLRLLRPKAVFYGTRENTQKMRPQKSCTSHGITKFQCKAQVARKSDSTPTKWCGTMTRY